MHEQSEEHIFLFRSSQKLHEYLNKIKQWTCLIVVVTRQNTFLNIVSLMKSERNEVNALVQSNQNNRHTNNNTKRFKT